MEAQEVFERYGHLQAPGRGYMVVTVAHPTWPTSWGASYVGDGWSFEVLPPAVCSPAYAQAQSDRVIEAMGEA